ncbi:MAG: hypothetical protein M3256_17880 [Actinomycetota bacterium]|nr:hypothetical protein [Actinomycetota bacterium]
MEPDIVEWSPPPKRPPMATADMAWVLDYLRHSFDRPSFDQADPGDVVDMAIWIEDLQRYPRDVCHEAIRSLRRGGSGRWFPAHAEVEQAIAAVLRKRDSTRLALVEDTGPPVPPAVAKANVAAARRLVTRTGEPQPIAAGLPRLSGSAHDLGDHQFCDHDLGDPEPDRPTEETPAP